MTFEQYFSTTYREVVKNYFPLLLASIVFNLLMILSFVFIIGLIIWPAISVASLHYILNYARNGNTDIGASLSQAFKNGAWLRIWPFAILYILAISFGFIALIIPGIYLTYRYAFSAYFIVDQGSGSLDGMGESAKLLHGIGFWKIFGIFVVIYIIQQLFLAIPVIGWIGFILLQPFLWYIYALPYINWTNNTNSNSSESVLGDEGIPREKSTY